MRRTKDQEVRDILEMFEAIEKVKPEACFPGFDTEGKEASAMPWEAGHHTPAEKLRTAMEGRMKSWPYHSHGRHLKDYRKMVALWTEWGRPKDLPEDRAKCLVEVGRIYIPTA